MEFIRITSKKIAEQLIENAGFKMKKSDTKPCQFDHNGECLICDCWPSECAWERYKNKDYTYETEDELNKMFTVEECEPSRNIVK